MMTQYVLSFRGSVKTSVTDVMSWETFAHMLFDVLVLYDLIVDMIVIIVGIIVVNICIYYFNYIVKITF